ncbi:hypothetical protein FSP39_015552 [Pinctada imbricata]|uniref:Uncharacterized protein n=1 Tax=Pinctada imbricata TaxID=66713 RepID=A0AA88YF91_PINIB|nr:hypothetical protein FSP39_015552 [Pinctada imbricata]
MDYREKMTDGFRHSSQSRGTIEVKELLYRDKRRENKTRDNASLKLYQYPEKFSHPGSYNFKKSTHSNRYPPDTIRSSTTKESEEGYIPESSLTTSSTGITRTTQTSYTSSEVRRKGASVNTLSTKTSSSYPTYTTSYTQDADSYTYSTKTTESSTYTSDDSDNSFDSGEHERALIIPFSDHAVAMYKKPREVQNRQMRPYSSESQTYSSEGRTYSSGSLSGSVSVGTSASGRYEKKELFDFIDEDGNFLNMRDNPLLLHYQSQPRSVGTEVHTHLKMHRLEPMHNLVKVRNVSTQTPTKYRPLKLKKNRYKFVNRDYKKGPRDPTLTDNDRCSDEELEIVEVQEPSQDDDLVEATINGPGSNHGLAEPEGRGAELIYHMDLVKRTKDQTREIDYGPKRKLIIPPTVC